MSKPLLSHTRAYTGGLFGHSHCLRTSVIVEHSNVVIKRHFTLTQYKRLKQKRNWVSKDDPNMGPDADFFLPDREVLGSDREINSTLHKYKIAPMQDAFRNLHLRGLLMLADGKTDKTKALHVPVKNDDFTIYYGENVPSFVPPSMAKVIQLEQYKHIVKEIKHHMSNTPSIVVHDGAIGSHPKYEIRARVITDDPTVALYLHHTVPRVNIGKVTEFEHDVTAYIVPKFKSQALKDVGITSERFIIADVARGIAIIGGPISTPAIRAGLAAVAQSKMFVDREVTPLDATIVGAEGSDKPILVFGNHELNLGKESGLSVYGSHNAAWTKDGLVRFFDGVTAPVGKIPETTCGDFVENVNGSLRATTRKPAPANIHSHPSAIVFLVNDSTGVLPTISQISADYVSQFMLAGYSGGGANAFKPLYSSSITADPHAVAASVGSIAKQNKVGAYVVNVSAKDKSQLSDEQLAKLLKAVANGGVKDAPTVSDVFSKITPISSIKGLDLPIDPTKRGWDAKSLKAEASKFEKSISDYLATTFPPPSPPPATPPPSSSAPPPPQK